MLAMLAETAGHIRFTDLGLDPVIFEIGVFKLRWYSLAYLAGIMVGYLYLKRLIRAPGAPLADRHADDMILYATLGIILGGRLGYVLFYKPDMFLDPLSILRLWDGGMSLHGGAIGTIFALWLLSRKEKLNFLRVCDYVACVAPFGLFFGRLANFVNGELFGRPTDVSWAIIFPDGGEVPRHPSQLYEAGLEGLLMMAILWFLFWKTDARYKPGLLMGVAALDYGFARFLVEFVRNPDVQLQWLVDATGLSMGQWLTIPVIAMGLWLVATANKRRQRVEPIAGSESVA